MLNIVIPMAGAGSRFVNAGYSDPKPLIPVHGVSMIELVIQNLRPQTPHRFLFLCQRDHVAEYGLRERFAAWAPGSELILLDGLTEGAACTVLAARMLIDNEEPLMIANSDQFVDLRIDDYLDAMDSMALDGQIMTMWADDPKWSFVGLDPQQRVTRVVEKQVISHEATVGIYNFRHGRDFVRSADAMISRNERVNNEFYVAPVYNELIGAGKAIGIHNIGKVDAGMYGLGTPADLERFLQNPLSIAACARIRGAAC